MSESGLMVERNDGKIIAEVLGSFRLFLRWGGDGTRGSWRMLLRGWELSGRRRAIRCRLISRCLFAIGFRIFRGYKLLSSYWDFHFHVQAAPEVLSCWCTYLY